MSVLQAGFWGSLEPFAELIGLALAAGAVAFLAGVLYRWYARARIPEGLSVLVGLSVVAVYLNTTGALASLVEVEVETAATTDLLALDTVLANVVTFAAAAAVAVAAGRVGDRVGEAVVGVSGARAFDADLSGLVKAVGRVITVDLPDRIEDIDGYDPVDEEIKETLHGKTLVFPRRLTVNELRERLVDRLRTDYGVGHVDVDLTEEGTVEYLAVGSREAGLGPSLPPETVALAVRADPAYSASPGDLVQLWERGTDGPRRVASGELRGAAGDVVTVAVDAADAELLDDETTYRVVTLPVQPRADREFASLLRAAAETMAVVTVAAGSDLDGAALGDVDASVVAVRGGDGGIEPIPHRTRALAAGETVYAIARPDRLRKLDVAARPAESAIDND